MDPITLTIAFFLGGAAIAFTWGYLKNWAKRKTDEITNWLLRTGRIRSASVVQGTYGVVSTIGNMINWGWNFITSGGLSDFVLSGIVSLGAEKWGLHIEESASNVPNEVKKEIREKGYYQLTV